MQTTHNNKYIRCIGLALALLILTAALAVPAGAADDSGDYTQWKQNDPAWNEAPAWSGGYSSFMANAGCWVTSLAMLLRHYGVVSAREDFDPWICAKELAEGGALMGNGDMVLYQVGSVYPGFDCAGEYGFSYDRLAELFDAGYACAVLINGGGHMVAVKDIREDGTVEIMDPGSDKTLLSECSGLSEIICFGGEEETEAVTAPPLSTPEVS